MKNSKYDESNFIVDYSGKQNKVRKLDESLPLDLMKQASSTAGKLLLSDPLGGQSKKNSRKRSLKKQKKSFEK